MGRKNRKKRVCDQTLICNRFASIDTKATQNQKLSFAKHIHVIKASIRTNTIYIYILLWLTGWQTDWLTDWQADSLADWKTDWRADWQTDCIRNCIWIHFHNPLHMGERPGITGAALCHPMISDENHCDLSVMHLRVLLNYRWYIDAHKAHK